MNCDSPHVSTEQMHLSYAIGLIWNLYGGEVRWQGIKKVWEAEKSIRPSWGCKGAQSTPISTENEIRC